MEEKSLKVYTADKTFFSRITSTLSKIFSPGKSGLNGVVIAIKRNNLLKNYENYIKNENNIEKKGIYLKKYEDSYSLYLEAIDKNIIDNIYKKVKNNTATLLEKQALSNYYMVIHLKDADYNEYKYTKQKFLLQLDNEDVELYGKEKLQSRYAEFYCDKIESLYKSLIKQYSIRLGENLTDKEKNEIYDKIFVALNEYISLILPKKMQEEPTKEIYMEIKEEYNEYKKCSNNKLDQVEVITKNMILLGMSRRLFTHSLPLTVAEQCYIKLLDNTRDLVVDTRVSKKKERAYKLLLNLIEEYSLKVLSTKVYWSKKSEKEEFQKFWKEYEKIEKIKDEAEKEKQKEILFIKADLNKVLGNENKYIKLISFYKGKLVTLGQMRKLPSKCVSLKKGIYIEDIDSKNVDIKKIIREREKEKAKVKKK